MNDLNELSNMEAHFILLSQALTDGELLTEMQKSLDLMRKLTTEIPKSENNLEEWFFWYGYEFSLLKYQYAMCSEWHIVRGYNDYGILKATYDLFWSCRHIDFTQQDHPSYSSFAKKTIT